MHDISDNASSTIASLFPSPPKNFFARMSSKSTTPPLNPSFATLSHKGEEGKNPHTTKNKIHGYQYESNTGRRH